MPEPDFPNVDEDAVKACVDLVRRTGAKEWKIGYDKHDHNAWYATATYLDKGKKVEITVAGTGPEDVADNMSRRLLRGASCTHCLRAVVLSGESTSARCRWTRIADKWERGCLDTHQPPVSGK